LAVVAIFGLDPWTIRRALALAFVVIVFAPLGDLCESLVKRDLNLKDAGAILPGHGGVLDRLDALLFVVPATYYLVRLLEL
jgi:phosphatidate cytidylyltransferase